MNIRQFNRNYWNLAFFPESDLKNVLNGEYRSLHWMVDSDRQRWYADPFILKVNDDSVVVLVEEYSYNIKRGRLARLIVDRNSRKLIDSKIILDLKTHLSFPMVLRKDEDIIIIPENSASGGLYSYLYCPDNDSMELIGEVVDEPLTDATILKLDDRAFLLSTSQPNPNGKELRIHEFDESELKARHHSTFTFDSCIARNAGSPIVYDGKIYRPAQDCNGEYGRGVILQEILYDSTTDRFDFRNSKTLYPFNKKYNLGLHTLNVHDGVCVIDGRGFLHPFVGPLIRPIINKLRR